MAGLSSGWTGKARSILGGNAGSFFDGILTTCASQVPRSPQLHHHLENFTLPAVSIHQITICFENQSANWQAAQNYDPVITLCIAVMPVPVPDCAGVNHI